MSGRILRDNVFMAERLDDRFEDFVDYRLYYNTKLGLLFMFFFSFVFISRSVYSC